MIGTDVGMILAVVSPSGDGVQHERLAVGTLAVDEVHLGGHGGPPGQLHGHLALHTLFLGLDGVAKHDAEGHADVAISDQLSGDDVVTVSLPVFVAREAVVTGTWRTADLT